MSLFYGFEIGCTWIKHYYPASMQQLLLHKSRCLQAGNTSLLLPYFVWNKNPAMNQPCFMVMGLILVTLASSMTSLWFHVSQCYTC